MNIRTYRSRLEKDLIAISTSAENLAELKGRIGCATGYYRATRDGSGFLVAGHQAEAILAEIVRGGDTLTRA